ncbi:cellulase family glycosylhydrolase [Mesorhizobium sp. NBSH29]|uniref:glycoside hydrolase family 5 protein n=1 Tax=Mesorhizobium sp. NBSH29 TaxID=2654249 RepID=UPI001896817F|nr:cellulase family glycosylhydrolase [Mesorhizobium sp. NBSH29]QPC85790.1 cellulase family glycosylhydrolase [Mesorhizobium sp. NBSH29]
MALMTAWIKNCLLALALALAWSTPVAAATFSMKRGINLDIWVAWPDEARWNEPDVLLPFPEWRQHIDRADLEALKQYGFDFVRMPVDPSPFLSAKTEGFRDRLFASVLDSVRMINKAGLKAVVDLHLFPAGGNRSIGMTEVMDDPAMFERYVELVRKMAGLLAKEDPQKVAFEPMNEPVVDCDDSGTNLWSERQQKLFAAARASATKLTLVLTGGCYSGAEALEKINPRDYPDDNIIWTFHSYAPFLLTHQGATWTGDFIQHVTGLPYPPHAAPPAELDRALDVIRDKIRADASWSRRDGMLAYLDEQIATMDTEEKLDALESEPFRLVEAWAQKHEVSASEIYLGEFGMIRQEYGNDYILPAASRAAYVKDMIARAENRGYAWSVWSYGGAFGVVEAFGGEKAEPDVLEVIKGLGNGE